jgi:hypothetical protein
MSSSHLATWNKLFLIVLFWVIVHTHEMSLKLVWKNNEISLLVCKCEIGVAYSEFTFQTVQISEYYLKFHTEQYFHRCSVNVVHIETNFRAFALYIYIYIYIYILNA